MRRKHIANGYSSSLAIVTEVGPAGWLGVVSNDAAQDGKAMNAIEIDSWSPPNAWEFKERMLRMEVPESELRAILASVNVNDLPLCHR
jgi:hypothetical protein